MTDKEYFKKHTDDEQIALLQHEPPVSINSLTWKDINDIERIINNVHYEFRNGIGEQSFGKEVLARFIEERDEQEQHEVDLEKEIERIWEHNKVLNPNSYDKGYEIKLDERNLSNLAHHFYELGLKARKEESK